MVIRNEGLLRGNHAEVSRGLITALVITSAISSYKWQFEYGEIPILNHKVDGIFDYEINNRNIKVGIEVVSSRKDLKKNRSKLEHLISLGVFHKAYILELPLNYIYHLVSTLRNEIWFEEL